MDRYYERVFISHSKDDPALRFFQAACSQVGTQAICMELEDIKPPPYAYIRESVNRSNAVFVLLSDLIEQRVHTNNWVSFEVGLAANGRPKVDRHGDDVVSGLDVWVFEPWSKRVEFPVPCCTYYARYGGQDAFAKQLVRVLRKGPQANQQYVLTCPNKDCQLSFVFLPMDVYSFEDWLHSDVHLRAVPCPSCRRDMPYPKE